MGKFIGREYYLKGLSDLTNKKSASFIALTGRRRIGKSTLIKEFGKKFDKFYSFIGLAPETGTTAMDQLEWFAQQMTNQFNMPLVRYNNWGDALWALGERLKSGRILLLFDEISWMAHGDHTFLGQIKNFWDLRLNVNDKLIFAVCGSVSAWIERNIMNSTGFVGRISYRLRLEEMQLDECAQFWPSENISAYEKFKFLSVTGGVPKYLEEINPNMSAEANIQRLCFTKGAILVEEFNQIFSDLFLRNSTFYKQILEALVSGHKDRGEICQILELDPGGRISEYLLELDLAGFIKRDFTWDIKSGLDSKISKYRLSDNYTRFYLKYIDKNMSKIERNSYDIQSLTSLPEWNSIMGFSFETLILNNRKRIIEAIGIRLDEVIAENPFYQTPKKSSAGCQIDYMIQTKFNTLYICEIKFSKNPIDASVITEMQKKIQALKYPKGYSCRPVLIHVNGVTEDVEDRDYFTTIIDAAQFLHPKKL